MTIFILSRFIKGEGFTTLGVASSFEEALKKVELYALGSDYQVLSAPDVHPERTLVAKGKDIYDDGNIYVESFRTQDGL